MRIIHVVYGYDTTSFRGGVTKMLAELASAQAKAGNVVEVWTVDPRNAPRREDRDGYIVRYFRPQFRLGLVGSQDLISELETTPRNGSIVHAHNTFHPLNLQIGSAAKRMRVPVFYHPHGALDPYLFSGLSVQSLKKRVYNYFFEVPNLNEASGVFALTALEAQQLREIGVRSAVHEVPNGITMPKLLPTNSGKVFRDTWNLRDDEKMILFLGRIVAKKGVHDVIDAYAQLGMPSARLVIAGSRDTDPAYSQRLSAQVTALGLDNRIIWAGHLDETKKPDAFAAADVFVHASYSEGMAMAILEAMSYGVPVIATKGCYMGHAAKAGAIVECEQGPYAVASALSLLLSEGTAGTALGKKGREFVSAHHSWLNLVDRMAKIYGAAEAAYR